MLLAPFILHFAIAYAGTCSARHRQGGSSGTKGAVQQQGGQQGGAPVIAPAPNAVSSSPAQSSSVAPVLGGSGSATDQTGGQTTGQTGGQTGDQATGQTGGQTGDQTTGQTGGQTSGQQNITQSGQQTGSGSTGQTGQGSSKSAAQQVGSGQNNLGQVDGGVASSSTVPAPAAASSSSASGGSTGGGDSSSASTGGGKTASFTQYGAGDTFGSGNCNTATAACGWYSNPGYNAAVSQALFGVGPGAGAGAACGQCYRLSPVGEGTNSIVVKVNNLCPASGNPLCAAAADVDVNFDLCKDDGAAKALFGSSPTGQVNGTYAPVACSEWSGSGNLT